jgi:hypothetical protein
VSLAEALSSENPENVPIDVATFLVERAGRSLKVRSGGLAFVDSGCTLKLLWRKFKDDTINGQQTICDRDEPIELEGQQQAMAGQWVEFEFRRTGHRPYAVRGRFQL